MRPLLKTVEHYSHIRLAKQTALDGSWAMADQPSTPKPRPACITKLAASQASEHTLMAIAGHVTEVAKANL